MYEVDYLKTVDHFDSYHLVHKEREEENAHYDNGQNVYHFLKRTQPCIVLRQNQFYAIRQHIELKTSIVLREEGGVQGNRKVRLVALQVFEESNIDCKLVSFQDCVSNQDGLAALKADGPDQVDAFVVDQGGQYTEGKDSCVVQINSIDPSYRQRDIFFQISALRRT